MSFSEQGNGVNNVWFEASLIVLSVFKNMFSRRIVQLHSTASET